MEIVTWILAHLPEIAAIVGALLSIASVVTALTKTTKDDAVVAWLRKALEFVSVLAPKDAPGTLKAPLTLAERPLLSERADGPEDPPVARRLDR